MFWVVLVLSVITFLIAAKSHGRQLRLERELAGYEHVTFGGVNPPFVEELWHKDRVEYWRTFAVFMTLAIFYVMAAKKWNILLPYSGENPQDGGWQFVLLVVPWIFVLTFTIVGMTSLIRLIHMFNQSESAFGPGTVWRQQALWGSAGWWSAVLALSVLTGILTFRRSG